MPTSGFSGSTCIASIKASVVNAACPRYTLSEKEPNALKVLDPTQGGDVLSALSM